MRSSRPLWVAVLMLCLSSFLLGCRPSYMNPVQAPQAIAPFADNAVVVFIYPQTEGKSPKVTILDSQARFLGTAVSGTHYGVLMTPGEHVLMAWGDDTTAIRANLAAGRVYYILVLPQAYPTGTVAQLHAVRPDGQYWAMVPGWLQATRQYAPDIPGGSAAVQKRQNEANAAVQRGQAVLAQYTPEQLAQRTLLAEHGVEQAVQPGGTMPPAAPPADATAAAPAAEAEQQADEAAAEPAAEPAEKKPLDFDDMTVVGKDASSGSGLRVIAKGTVTTEKGVSIGFSAKPESFTDKFVGYTYDAKAFDQLAADDALMLFVVGVAYKQVAFERPRSEKVFEDHAGNPALAPEDWGGSHLNGAWVRIEIESIEKSDSGARLNLKNRVFSTIASIHKSLQAIRSGDGYTLKPLIRIKPAAYTVRTIPADRAKHKAGVFALLDKAFAATGEMGCNTEAEVTSVENDEAKMQGKVASRDGKPWVWCDGAIHKWLGTLKYRGHTFRSSQDAPLQFKVDKDQGYVYLQGKGSLSLPSGRMIQLP